MFPSVLPIQLLLFSLQTNSQLGKLTIKNKR